MQSGPIPAKPDVVTVSTEPRPTPPPPQRRFNEVLARGAGTLVRGAEIAMSQLPGLPLMAAAVRGAPAVPAATPMGSGGIGTGMVATTVGLGPTVSSSIAEGPGPSAVLGAAGPAATAPLGGVVDGSGGGIEGSIAQSQEMNLYFLQIQEQMNADDRSYTALSNVLKSEHDTVQNAIGNLK